MHFIPSYLNASAVLKWQSEGEGGFVVVVVGCVIKCLHSQKISSLLHSDYGKSGGCYRCRYELCKNHTTTRRGLALHAPVLHIHCALCFPGTLQQRSSSEVLTQFNEIFQKTTFSFLIIIFVSNFIEGK